MLALITVIAAAASGAPSIAVEAGAATTLGRHLCKAWGDERVRVSEGRLIVAPASEGAQVTVAAGDCQNPELLPIAVVPTVAHRATIARLYVDEGRLELHSGGLAGAVIAWRLGGSVWSVAVCSAGSEGADNAGTGSGASAGTGAGGGGCSVSLPVDDAFAVLGGAAIEILRLPPHSPTPRGDIPIELWPADDEGSAPVPLDLLRVTIQRFVLAPPLVRASSIDAWREQVALPLIAPNTVASVSCRPASCWVGDGGRHIVVVPPTSGDAVSVTLRLRERVAVQQGDAFTSSVTVTLPLARCQLRPLTPFVLGGTEDHRLPVELGDRCPDNLADLAVETSPPSAAYIERVAGDGKHVEVRLGHVPRRVEMLEMRLLRASTRTVIGVARLDVRSAYMPTQVELVDEVLGELSTIPTNREVRLQWAGVDPKLGASIVPVAVPGYYSLRQEEGETFIRGETRTSGAIPLRFAYVGAGSEPFAVFDTDVHFPVKPVNVPVSLAPDDARVGRLFTVFCRNDASGDEREIRPGELVSLPYAARGSCNLRIDRRVLTPEDGTQRIRVTVSITTPAGAARNGGFSQVMVLSTGPSTDSVWLGGNELMLPFDRISVHIAHDDLPGHYAVEGQASGLPARRYQMIFGDERLRLYGSAAVPTGLYRVVSGASAGVLQFSAGVLARLALLNREGREFPLDLEFGLLGTNISDRAELSIVGGAGITVPLLNAQEMGQAAIGIHAWVEYAPLRKPIDGRRIAFIFGPSVSLGDFGTNL